MLKFEVKEKVKPKILINIGALLDIPTGGLVKGQKGEYVINGGLGQITADMGPGNNYKSVILHYMALSALDKILETHQSFISTYDSENNISIDRLEKLSRRFNNVPEEPITTNGVWGVTDASLTTANEWVEGLFKHARDKGNDKKLLVEYTAFKDPYTKETLKMPMPTFVELDSLTEFMPESVNKMLDNGVDGSETNVYAAKQNLFKTKFLLKVPKITTTANIYMLLTAHIGEKINMDSSPMAKFNKPIKKLQYIKENDVVKGVGSKFSFLLSNGWLANSATLLRNQTTKLPEYPKNKDDLIETDLNIVRLTQLRSKSGPSGYVIELLVSQKEGVLPTLTEFHHIKTNDRYGISGTNTSYYLDILPDVKLSRTTVRNKIDTNPILRRAINITSEILQLKKFHGEYFE